MLNKKLLFAIGFAAFVVAVASATMLALAYHAAVDGLEKVEAERDAVAEVERFIYQRYPSIEAATRRGHAEILIDSTYIDCVDITENAIACPGYGITKLAPEVRVYAQQVADSHGL